MSKLIYPWTSSSSSWRRRKQV